MALFDLLSRGYFPKELPRPYSTLSFATLLTSGVALPGDFAKTAAKGNQLPVAKAGRYSHARSGLLRRQLSICNPVHYFLLSKELIQNWAALLPSISGTPLAATAPEFKIAGRAIDGKYSQGDRPAVALDSRLGRRYVLQTDISRFYSSIYTHSLPWAVHTKAVAKANHKLTLLGNRLDY